MPQRNRPARCPQCHGKAQRDVVADVKAQGMESESAGWPILSEAAAVHPEQIPEARAEAEKRGVPTDFTRDGRVVFRDRSHRRRYCKAMGLHDLDGGYSDA